MGIARENMITNGIMGIFAKEYLVIVFIYNFSGPGTYEYKDVQQKIIFSFR